MNPDGYVYTGQDMQSGNMYAYCGNGPVARSDAAGYRWMDSNNGGGGAMLFPVYSAPAVPPAATVVTGAALAAIIAAAVLNPPQPWQMSSAALSSYQASQAKSQEKDITIARPQYDDDSPRKHHIVAQNAKRAEPARDMLIRYNINYKRDPQNTVVIPQLFHKSMHTTGYYDYVNLHITGCQSENEVIEQLAKLKAEITIAANGGPIPWI